jgi:hypothetical protein
MSQNTSTAQLAAFKQLRDADEAPDLPALYAFYDALPAMPAEKMIGDWKGGILSRNHPVDGQLQAMRWDGKRFVSSNEVYPIISLDAQGQRSINNVLGTASLREVVFRGVSTATMIYDTAPVFDHFRQVTPDLVVGVMDRKGDSNPPLFFYLERLTP